MIERLKRLYKLLNPNQQKVILEYPLDLKARYSQPYHQGLFDIIQKGNSDYAELLQKFNAHIDFFKSVKNLNELDSNDVNSPSWNNGYLPGLDVISLYGIISEYKPSKYVEIGSGNSTKIARKAIEAGNLETKIHSIDPYPRAEIDQLSDVCERTTIDKADLSVFDGLGENDIVYVDNSHVCFPNSDVTVFFLDILPRLKPGVIVHVHDIYIPYDYPDFMIERYYSEQYLLMTYLINAKNYKVICPNYYIFEQKSLLHHLDPIWDAIKEKKVEKHGGSFWFRITD
ncbi:class I SAM-dependent methyltransferase [bacterium]|nr:class I SAM-dependent methyltransferase [bacterium]